MSTLEFNELLVGSSEHLRPYAINLTRDPEAAKDLYQETLCRALANKDKYGTGTNIKAWLYTIMRNIFINDYRRNKLQQAIFDNRPNEEVKQKKEASVSVESEYRHKEIKTAVSRLPQIFKTPFLLYFEGYKYHEIAMALSEPLGTIKSRIHFARKLLKDQITRN